MTLQIRVLLLSLSIITVGLVACSKDDEAVNTDVYYVEKDYLGNDTTATDKETLDRLELRIEKAKKSINENGDLAIKNAERMNLSIERYKKLAVLSAVRSERIAILNKTSNTISLGYTSFKRAEPTAPLAPTLRVSDKLEKIDSSYKDICSKESREVEFTASNLKLDNFSEFVEVPNTHPAANLLREFAISHKCSPEQLAVAEESNINEQILKDFQQTVLGKTIELSEEGDMTRSYATFISNDELIYSAFTKYSSGRISGLSRAKVKYLSRSPWENKIDIYANAPYDEDTPMIENYCSGKAPFALVSNAFSTQDGTLMIERAVEPFNYEAGRKLVPARILSPEKVDELNRILSSECRVK